MVSVYHGCNDVKWRSEGDFEMMSPPLKIAAGATMLAGVAVVCVLAYGARTVPSAPVLQSSAQIEPSTPTQVSEPIADAIVSETAQTGPVFDLVRVDESGSAVIAGTAAPDADVAITLDGDVFETVKSDNNGAFVALVQLPEAEEALTVGLKQLRDGAEVAVSLETVLVVAPAPELETATLPTIVLANESGAEMLQGGARAVSGDLAENQLSLDTISYDTSGAVVLSGQGTGAQFVRVYVDNTPIETELVPDDGNWRVVLLDVDQGLYTLRVDEINPEGNVQARVESPFQRVSTNDVLAAGVITSETGRVVVQPGHTLWELAETTYGDGVKYVQIFHANRDTIRDANLIYPGQIFELPE